MCECFYLFIGFSNTDRSSDLKTRIQKNLRQITYTSLSCIAHRKLKFMPLNSLKCETHFSATLFRFIALFSYIFECVYVVKYLRLLDLVVHQNIKNRKHNNHTYTHKKQNKTKTHVTISFGNVTSVFGFFKKNSCMTSCFVN